MNLGFLASGRGSNMQAVLDACRSGRIDARPCVVVSNNSRSGAVARARQQGIPHAHLSSVTHPDPEQLDRAIRDTLLCHDVDLVILPVGGGPTIGADGAAAIVERLKPSWVVPMHYRTPRISFLETADAFLDRIGNVKKLDSPSFDTTELESDGSPLVVVPAAP